MRFSSRQRLDERLQPVLDLLRRQELVEQLVDRGAPDDLASRVVHRRHETALAAALRPLHPADLAHLAEMLPPGERSAVWRAIPDRVGGEVLAEVSDAVAEGLIEETAPERLLAMGLALDADDLGFIDDLLPAAVREELVGRLHERDRSWHETSVTYPDDSVGFLMQRDMLMVEGGSTIRQVLKHLRRLGGFPEQTDQLFVVDRRRHLLGALPLTALFLHSPQRVIDEIMHTDLVAFTPEQEASAAAQSFDRYDLVSAPVVDSRDRLLGRLTVDAVLDFIREEAEEDAFLREGLRPEEDLFGPVLSSARSRWLWLALNLLTALIASRVIGVFESSIEKLVALATLMPIVASIGGNTGNQTVALVIRGLALDQITPANLRYLALKELGVALVNGLLWGSVIGGVAYLLYRNPDLGLVMAGATLLNLLVAAAAGIAVPYAMERIGRDPALGSSVVLTFITDSMGFFIFLGMSSLLLVGPG
jgi:magnesium transporter